MEMQREGGNENSKWAAGKAEDDKVMRSSSDSHLNEGLEEENNLSKLTKKK